MLRPFSVLSVVLSAGLLFAPSCLDAYDPIASHDTRFAIPRPWYNCLNSQNAQKCLSQKSSRRLELSISKNTPHGRWGQGAGSVDPRFPAGLPFPVPEILEFVAFRDSGKFFQQFSRDFPGVFPENPRTDPGNSHSLLEFSD